MEFSEILVDFDMISSIQFCSSYFSWGMIELVGTTSFPCQVSYLIPSFICNCSL